MKTIVAFLEEQKRLCMPIMRDFVEDFERKYGPLTREYGELAHYLHDYLLRGGKWHRPALSLLTYQLFGGQAVEKVRKASLTTEIIHRFLLIHDDIIDQDMMRHGGPTLEKIYHDRFIQRYPQATDTIYSKAQAIVAGDVVAVLGSEIILQSNVDSATQLALWRAINQMILETAAGWQLQNEQNYMPIDAVSYDDFFKGMQLVSCQYSIMWPLRIGQLLAGRLDPSSWDQAIEAYGWNCGAAFQIVDDIIGMFGDEKETGKPSGHDYREGKKTFLVLKAYEQAQGQEREFLANTLGTHLSDDDLLRVKDLIVKTGSLDYSKKLAQEYTAKALVALEGVSTVSTVSNDALELLADFARFLANRAH